MEPSLKKNHIHKPAEFVSFSKMISNTNANDKCYLFTGLFFAFIAGCAMPVWALLLGDLMDNFGGTTTPEMAFDNIKFFSSVIIIVGLGTWICTCIYWSAL